jgi:hypothetical protein
MAVIALVDIGALDFAAGERLGFDAELIRR